MATNPDRRAAEYVLPIVGNILIKENGQEREIMGASQQIPLAKRHAAVRIDFERRA